MVSIRDILRISNPAICGITEKEVVVPKAKKAAYIAEIKKAGFMIVGTGAAGRETVKIWFARFGL